MADDAKYNFGSYAECFISENLIRKYTVEKGIELSTEATSDIEKMRHREEETKKKWISLIKTYFQLGGQQLQPTVVSTEVLKAAQQNPEQFRNIIVKVGGYSAYFTDLGKEIQDEIISRTEHKMV